MENVLDLIEESMSLFYACPGVKWGPAGDLLGLEPRPCAGEAESDSVP